jgi:TetR/AcrR family transcriptional regulator, repressor of fatR-cypB operon
LGVMDEPAYISQNDAPGKKRILSAALKLFVERGVSETTIREIAARAKCTNPALFKHFESKDALALYLFECTYLALFEMTARAFAGQGGLKKRQRAVIEAYIEALARDSAAVLYAQENIRHFWPQTSAAIRRHSILRLICEMLEEGQRRGEVTHEVSAKMLTVVWAGTMQQFARMWYFGELGREKAPLAAQLETALMRAIGS